MGVQLGSWLLCLWATLQLMQPGKRQVLALSTSVPATQTGGLDAVWAAGSMIYLKEKSSFYLKS